MLTQEHIVVIGNGGGTKKPAIIRELVKSIPGITIAKLSSDLREEECAPRGSFRDFSEAYARWKLWRILKVQKTWENLTQALQEQNPDIFPDGIDPKKVILTTNDVLHCGTWGAMGKPTMPFETWKKLTRPTLANEPVILSGSYAKIHASDLPKEGRLDTEETLKKIRTHRYETKAQFGSLSDASLEAWQEHTKDWEIHFQSVCGGIPLVTGPLFFQGGIEVTNSQRAVLFKTEDIGQVSVMDRERAVFGVYPEIFGSIVVPNKGDLSIQVIKSWKRSNGGSV